MVTVKLREDTCVGEREGVSKLGLGELQLLKHEAIDNDTRAASRENSTCNGLRSSCGHVTRP